MNRACIAGWAGVFSGIGLAIEVGFFMASGWSAAAFSTLDGAVGVAREGGQLLRLGVAFGVFNLAPLVLFFAGLAERLGQEAPELGDAVLYCGLVGIAIHALVPVGFYQPFLGSRFSRASRAPPRSGWRRCSCWMSLRGLASSSWALRRWRRGPSG